VKTEKEIKSALDLGVHINADSLEELNRINQILGNEKPKGTIGIRINPQVGTGTILSTSVAGDYSKFGVPIKEYREELIESFIKFDWLAGVHLHIGSQGCEVELLLEGIRRVMDFADQADKSLQKENKQKRISIIDIGGGLPVSYYRNVPPIDMSLYKTEIEHRFPQLFTNEIKLITEFGRTIYANTGWVASKVEYVKKDRGINTATIHVGADMFIRECYHPNDWHHEITVLDHAGSIKSGIDENPTMIAGPLCFAGDLIAREILLPKVEPGDYIVIHDSGAYTLSMWSRYNSRQTPKVIGYFQEGDEFEILKKREDIKEIIDFWQ
jgi:diaminopimelate decarboxylase